ncbi:MAG TPA: phosphatase, partial [Halieaceae bacterium]|nr:phosphatase [Halieaceae bacterium]
MLIDFHTHTTASDGALSPVALLERARDRGIRLLAITDHDTVAGYRAVAAEYNATAGEMRVVPGVELSCVWSGVTV